MPEVPLRPFIRLDEASLRGLQRAAGPSYLVPIAREGLLVHREEERRGWDPRLRVVNLSGMPARELCWGGAALCNVALPTATGWDRYQVFDWELVVISGLPYAVPALDDPPPTYGPPLGSLRTMFGDFRVREGTTALPDMSQLRTRLTFLGFRVGPATPEGLIEPQELWRPVWVPSGWTLRYAGYTAYCADPSASITVKGTRVDGPSR